MSVYAAVMTGKGTGAISTIQLFGESAETLLKKVFKPDAEKSAKIESGNILLGSIVDGTETIDQVAVGCEDTCIFAINCHGNPLIVETIMQLLSRCGAALVTCDELLAKMLAFANPPNTIALEARLAQPKACTIEGTKIILNQLKYGLVQKAEHWLRNIDTLSTDEIAADAAQILRQSQPAALIIAGCAAVIAGPPNSGKSTLFNCLCGRQKAIAAEVAGTTRDWVGARCRIGPVVFELVDTAGLDEKLVQTPESEIERAAQHKAVEMLDKADMVFLVLDSSRQDQALDARLLEKISSKRVLTVLNKCDLPPAFNPSALPEILADRVQVSAKSGAGIDSLLKKVLEVCGTAEFDLTSAVCFTDRQCNLLEQLTKATSRTQAHEVITELLNGPTDPQKMR